MKALLIAFGQARTPAASPLWLSFRQVWKAAACLCVAVACFCIEAKGATLTNDLTEVPIDILMTYQVQSVYGASKHEQKLSEAPSSVTIVDSEEIKLYGHRSFADVLESVRSLYVSYDRNYSYLGVRGFNRPGDYSSRVLVLVDGHRVNENVFDSVLIGYDFPLDVDTIERIEVIRGPSSSIYGNNAFFGVINVISKNASINGTETSVSYGSFDSWKARMSYGTTFSNDVRLFISGSFYDSAGHESLYYPEYNTSSNRVNFGRTRDTDYERYYKAFTSLTYHDFTLEMAFSSREKGIPTGSYGTIFNDKAAQTTDNFAWIDLKYDHTFGEDWHLVSRIAYDNYYYYGDYPVMYPPRVIYSDYAYGNSWSTDTQLSKRVFDRHTLTVGAETRHNFNQDQGNKDTYVPRTVYNDHRSTFNVGVYGQAEVALMTNLLLNAGVRYDHFETFGDTANPRVGLIYNPLERTTLKALYGKAFKAPNAYELYYSGPNNLGNTALVPETITTYEVVLEQGLTSNLTFIATAFYYEIDDLINQVEEGKYLIYRNLDQVTAKGVEFELNGKWAHGIRSRISYSYQETEDDLTGEQLSNSPRHLAKINIAVPVWKEKIFTGFEVLYTSRARTLHGDYADGHWVANFTLFSRDIVKNLELSASIYNLFDTRYSHPAAGEHLQDTIEQDGRSFRLKLTYRF